MTLWLAAIPTKDAAPGAIGLEQLEAMLARARDLAGPRYRQAGRVSRAFGPEEGVVAALVPSDERERFEEMFAHGVVASDGGRGIGDTDALLLAGGRLRFGGRMRGCYTAIAATRSGSSVLAWGTTPALDAIHFGCVRGWIVISNRPLMVALTLGAVAYDPVWIEDYLATGFAIRDHAPFAGVRVLFPEESIEVTRGVMRIVDSPVDRPDSVVGSLRDLSLVEAGERLGAIVSTAAREMVDPGDVVEVRTSGGMDTRLLAAAFANVGVPIRGVTFGKPGDRDVILASEIGRRLGFSVEVREPELNSMTCLREAALVTIRQSGGVLPSEAHLLPYAGAGGASFGCNAISFGNWPLYKGGIAKRMVYPQGGHLQAVHRAISPLVGARTVAVLGDVLGEWFGSALAQSDLEKLYLYARKFRSGRWMQGHFAHYSQGARPVYPISDVALTHLCDSRPMLDKVSLRLLFYGIRSLWAEGVELPLESGRWRFALRDDVTEEEAAALSVAADTDLFSDVAAGARVASTYPSWFEGRLGEAAREVCASPAARWLEYYWSPEFREWIGGVASGQVGADAPLFEGSSVHPSVVKSMLWRSYAVSLLLSDEWWTV